MAAKAWAASSTVRVSGPGLSRLGEKGTMPSSDQRPAVVLRPTVPVIAAGMRTEPPESLPRAT